MSCWPKVSSATWLTNWCPGFGMVEIIARNGIFITTKRERERIKWVIRLIMREWHFSFLSYNFDESDEWERERGTDQIRWYEWNESGTTFQKLSENFLINIFRSLTHSHGCVTHSNIEGWGKAVGEKNVVKCVTTGIHTAERVRSQLDINICMFEMMLISNCVSRVVHRHLELVPLSPVLTCKYWPRIPWDVGW